MMSAVAPAGPLSGKSLRPDGLPEPASPFEAAVVDLLAGLFSAYPTMGTSVGYHDVDGRWPALDEPGREARQEMLRAQAGRLAAFAETDLGADERIDRGALVDLLARFRFAEEELREEVWDPLSLVHLLGSGLFGPLAREYAPWSQRGRALLERLQGMPRAVEQGLGALTGLPGRPVSLLHLETALSQSSGVDELVTAVLAEARRRAAEGEAPELLPALESAGQTARSSLDLLRAGLDGPVRARAAGEGRMGAELFAARLRHTLGSDLAPDDLRARAWSDHAAVRAEMLRLARGLWPAWLPDEPLPDVREGDADAESAVVRRVLDAIALEHRQPSELLGFCRGEMTRIEDFCREREVISLPADPLAVTWTPTFMRAYGRAFLDPPGPLDIGQVAHFWITPPDQAAPAEAVESHLREDNDRMLRILCIHEGIPGHYLQLAASNRGPSLARAVVVDGAFAEGWAVYVTQVMMDLGYAADDPAVLLTHWKMYLRAVTNAILDVEVHAGSMSEAEAMDLMVRRGFQEEDEARAKWLRARLTATQLSTYYVGSLEMWDLEVAAREAAARAAGAGPDAVPRQRICGGLGATPGFDQRAHLEAVIAHGSPPIRWVRRCLGL